MSKEVLEKYDYLIAEVGLDKYFKDMEKWKKPCTEIEIYKHCDSEYLEEHFLNCNFTDCKDCPGVKLSILKEIDAFADELRAIGYFVYKNINYWLIVSKIQSIAQVISQLPMSTGNAGMRGIAFGYSIKKIKNWIKKLNKDGLKE